MEQRILDLAFKVVHLCLSQCGTLLTSTSFYHIIVGILKNMFVYSYSESAFIIYNRDEEYILR